MANWTDIDTNNLLPGQPFTSPIALALEENPRAIADGAAGAPKISDKVITIEMPSFDPVVISDVEDYGGFWLDAREPNFMEFSEDGVTYGGNILISATNGTRLFVDFQSSTYFGVDYTNNSPIQGTDPSINTNVSHIKFSFRHGIINLTGGKSQS